MAKQIIEYRCLLISPSDVIAERDALSKQINLWNASVGSGLNAKVELVRWEYHSVPDMSATPQTALNQQIVDGCDLWIAIFWSRLGSPTTDHASGSVEEIMRLVQQGSRVIVYFSIRDIPQQALNDDQYAKLVAVKKQFPDQGLYATYSSTEDLCMQVQLHLTKVVSDMLAKDKGAALFVPASGTLLAPLPEVRVFANGSIVQDGGPPPRSQIKALSIIVQNHSPVTVYITNVGFELKSGQRLMVQRDFITGSFQGKRELQSGDSVTTYYDPAKLIGQVDEIVCAIAIDAVGRVYRSSKEFMSEMIQILAGT